MKIRTGIDLKRTKLAMDVDWGEELTETKKAFGIYSTKASVVASLRS
jgi:hypothetical protein